MRESREVKEKQIQSFLDMGLLHCEQKTPEVPESSGSPEMACPAMSHDELLHIMARMPSKAVCKFKTLSKEIRQRTSQGHFTRQHFEESRIKGDTSFFMVPHLAQIHYVEQSWYPLTGRSDPFTIPRQVMGRKLKSRRIISINNGILLCRENWKYQGQLLLWNPITAEEAMIPPPGVHPAYDWKMALECTQDSYRILLVEDHEEWGAETHPCKLYTPETQCWRSVPDMESQAQGLLFEKPVVIRGKVHYMTDYLFTVSLFRPRIIVYDLDSFVTTEIPIPEEAAMDVTGWGSQMSVHQIPRPERGSLSLLKHEGTSFSVWNMKNYDTKRWTFVTTIRMDMTLSLFDLTGSTVINGKTLVVVTEDLIYQFHMDEGNRMSAIAKHRNGQRVIILPYTDMLHTCFAPAQEEFQVCTVDKELRRLPGIIRASGPHETLDNWESLQLLLPQYKDS